MPRANRSPPGKDEAPTPPRRTAAQRRGAWGEDAAAAHVRARGAAVLERNARSPWGEVDLVVLDRGVIAMCEVKTRRVSPFVSGRDAVGPRKRERLARTALHVLADRGVDQGRVPCRFDVIEVLPGPSGAEVTWLKDAFQVDLQ